MPSVLLCLVCPFGCRFIRRLSIYLFFLLIQWCNAPFLLGWTGRLCFFLWLVGWWLHISSFFLLKKAGCAWMLLHVLYIFLRPIYTRDNRWWWWKISGAYTIYVSGMNRSDIFFFFVFPFFFSNKPKWIFKKMWIVYCRYHQSFH